MIRAYKSEDYDMLKMWFKGYNQPCPTPNLLSKNGYVNESVAAGFIYSTDSDLCWIENLIGNPFVDVELRNIALDELVEAMIKDVKGKTIVCFSDLPFVVSRARKHGFTIHETKYTFMSKGE